MQNPVFSSFRKIELLIKSLSIELAQPTVKEVKIIVSNKGLIYLTTSLLHHYKAFDVHLCKAVLLGDHAKDCPFFPNVFRVCHREQLHFEGHWNF
jgi:hypothetical protein